MLKTEDVPAVFAAFRGRWVERDTRMKTMLEVVRGDGLETTDPSDTDHDNTSPNLIQVALEDTAESAATMPSLRIIPPHPDANSKRRAEKMERIAMGYLDRSGGELFLVRNFLHLFAFGFMAPAAFFDQDTKLVRADVRDAVGCYPESDWKPGMAVRRCLFARDIYITQLPVEYQAKLKAFETDQNGIVSRNQNSVTLVEYFDEDEILVAAMYSKAVKSSPFNPKTDFLPVELERFKHGYSLNPVALGQRITLDGEPRGQFDQVVAPMRAHARLMSMAIDYADQSVYSDIWVTDLQGEMPFGGGGVIQLGPNGKIGRVPPAVSSLSLFNELDQLLNTIHLGGRWPKSRPGEIDQSIASAKFLETSVGVMNTALRTAHFVMKYTLERLIRIMFTMDKAHGLQSATTTGVLKNQEFIEEYNPQEDIDLTYQVKVEYGLGLGKDAGQSAVLHIQYQQSGMISKEFVQESIEGVTDVERERRRIDSEKFTDMMFAKLMQGVEQGSIPDKALVQMAKARMEGESLIAIFNKYVVEPQDQQQATGITSGLTGALQQPGGAPPPPGPAAPPVPPPPDMVGGLAQLSTPAGGPGNFIGTRVKQGP